MKRNDRVYTSTHPEYTQKQKDNTKQNKNNKKPQKTPYMGLI
jgi:hypothetical protein